ncbi:MAG: ABC transporter ATP-binding protein [Clostridiales bacterium]|jgi:ABC-2 type transport system ATP-binding protein|nr:ABC transporter ATP-binding protein [Clostridiales bacterium]
MQAVVAENLTKIFPQGKKAVDAVSFALGQGEIFGFLGPNGAGKTTAVKLLNGMLTPTAGCCRVFGTDPAADPCGVHKLSGVVTEHAQMYEHMTGMENLLFFGAVFGVNARECRARADRLFAALELMCAKDQKLSTYSTGMRQRLSLARAMIHRPKILFLDEPTSGLDPENAQNVNDMIKRLAHEEGTTIFLCTHQLRYAQELCTAYGLIDEGALLAAGTLAELRTLVFSGLTVRLTASLPPDDIPYTALNGHEFSLTLQTEDDIPPLVKKIVERGGKIYGVSARQLTLEEIYFALLEKRGVKEAAS